MAALTGIAAAVGVATSLAGTGLQVMGQMQAAEQSKKQAAIAKTQMNLEATRQRRQVIRQAMIARSDAVSNATAQGASKGSGLQGGLAQVTNEAGGNVSNTILGQQLGNQMYKSQVAQANAGTLSAIGSGISSLGGAIVQNQEPINRVGTYLTTPTAPA